MKKFLAIFLALIMALTLAACGATDDTPEGDIVHPETPLPGDNPALDESAVIDPGDAEESETPLDLLTNIWNNMPEDMKPMAFGGDYHEENQVENAPGIHSTATEEDAQSLDTNFGFPANEVSNVGQVACIRHMLNANSFSCAAYEILQPADSDVDLVSSLSEEIRDNLMNRAYMCGWPEQLEIIAVGRNVVAFYGSLDIVNAFKDSLTGLYGDSAVVEFEEDMSEAGGDNTFAFPVPDDPA